MPKNNVWSQIKKQQEEQAKRQENSVWANIADFMDNEEESFSPPVPVTYEPVKVDNEIPIGSIVFDLETGSVDYMWTTGPEFIRLSGHSIDDGPVINSNSPFSVMEAIMYHKGWIIGHNIMNFDSILLDRLHGVSILALAKAERLRDTKLIAFLADPPYSRMKEGEIEKIYSLEAVGTKYMGEGKMKDAVTGKSVLKRLAQEFGGYDQIPQDNEEYNEYLKRDVEVTRDLIRVLPMNDYVIREHKIAAVAATISMQGFRVDIPLLEERIRQGEEKRLNILTSLQGYGLPSPEETKAPHRTNKGLAAIEAAFSELGINLERTATGRPAMGKPVLEALIEREVDNQEAVDLAEAVMSLNGIRCVPLNSEILTQTGWVTCDEVEVGDKTLGLNDEGLLEWTTISEVSIYNGNYPLIEMSNNHFGVVCTPNHRWVSDHRYNSSNWTKENPGTSRRVRGMREASSLGAYDRVVVSAMTNTTHSLLISVDEAEIVGWLLGDGYLKWNPNKQVKSNYLVCNITQSKPEGVAALRALTKRSGLIWSEAFSSNGSYVFTLKSSDATDLWQRCGFGPYETKISADLTKFVVSLGPEERKAFIRGFYGAEGHLVDGNRVVSQMPGNIAEAVRLAVFLDGHRATRTNKSVDGCDKIRCDAPPTITGERLKKVEVSPGSVWCPTTGLGTWVMRQGDQICLTGNTIYGNIYDNLVNDRVHPSINLRQSTGRWSIQKPGLTVIGKRGGKVIERAVFLPDNEDHVLISADLAQVDARAVAGLSQDIDYLKLFEGGRDAHTEMAILLYGTETARERVKAFVHGVNYGMRAKKLSLTSGMPLNEADDFIYNFEKSFPRLVRWQNEQREIGETIGILYNGYGRMMRIEPDRAFTQSPALMGQSTARDILMEGILRLWDVGGESVIKMIRAVVHDELVMSVPKKDVEEIEQLVVKAMSFPWCPVGSSNAVEITAGLNKRGTQWADCYRKGD